MTDEAPSTRPKPFVFVLMPFDAKFSDIHKFGIQGAAAEVGAYAERVDEQTFTEGMLDRIFTQIDKADVVVADMTGRNPNVFYEVGYAHALDKIVLLLTQDSNDIPFDLKHRQHTVYSGKIEVLRGELAKRLQWAIAESRRRSERTPAEFISLQIFGKPLVTGFQQENLPIVSGAVPTAGELFNIPLQLRNDGAETLKDISHVYLFADEKAAIVPARERSRFSNFVISYGGTTSGTSTTPEGPEPLDSFTANAMDAPDGLTRQYRLPITFPSLPPGAIERAFLSMMFDKGKASGDSVYRIRLHTETRFYDYRVRIKISVEKPKEGSKKPKAD
jgi:nucleoside 2-deoxyribosyltransferase